VNNGGKMRYEDTTEMCLKEMFRRVGEKYPNKELTDQPEWYKKRTWTEAEENDFRKWMGKLLKKRHGWKKVLIDREIGMFLLNWGWAYAK
jgi:hypothetical protein